MAMAEAAEAIKVEDTKTTMAEEGIMALGRTRGGEDGGGEYY